MGSFIRYPGGKNRLRKVICAELSKYQTDSFCDPFFGGGAISIDFLIKNPHIKNIWINDKDIGVADLWTSVIRNPKELQKLIQNFVPTVDVFFDYKKELLSNESVTNRGFKKLVIHQISYSGLGTKSGGPLGGKSQNSKYKIDCRWSPNYMCKKIDHLHDLFSNFNIKEDCCTSYDFSEVIVNNSAMLYLDPPYYIKGNELYQFSFDEQQHKHLSELLKNTPYWVLSYDNCAEIRDLYKWALIKEINANYTITSTIDKKTGKRFSNNKSELLIQGYNHVC
jgi:DNA adenine methylase